jgi:hypothetical protein
LAEIVDSLSKLVDKVDVARQSIAALSLGGCIVSGAVLLLFDQPFTMTFSGTAWNLPLVGLVSERLIENYLLASRLTASRPFEIDCLMGQRSPHEATAEESRP